MHKDVNRQRLPRNKQLALCVLLATRSAFRGRLEGIAELGQEPNPPTTPDDLVQRAQANRPAGIDAQDIDSVFLEELFVPPAPAGGPLTPNQINNVTTNIARIMTALDIEYDPNRPDCPEEGEVDRLTLAILHALR